MTADGQIAVNAALSAGNQISLTSTNSNIQEANGLGSITTSNLQTDAQDGFLGSRNNVGSFSATNRRAGAIYFAIMPVQSPPWTLGTINQLASRQLA